MRVLKDSEHYAIQALAAEFDSPAERDQLLADLDNCEVEEKTPDGSRLVFNITGYVRPPGHKQNLYRAKDGFRAEGSVNDADGSEMDVLLFADQSGRLYELELVKHLSGAIIKTDWSTFRVK